MRKFLHTILITSLLSQSIPSFRAAAQAAPAERGLPAGILVPCSPYASPIVRGGIIQSTMFPEKREVIKILVTKDQYRNFESYDYHTGLCTKLGSFTVPELLAKVKTSDVDLNNSVRNDLISGFLIGIATYIENKGPKSVSDKTMEKAPFQKKVLNYFEKLPSKLDVRKFKLGDLNGKRAITKVVGMAGATMLAFRFANYTTRSGPLGKNKQAKEVLRPEIIAGCSYKTNIPIEDFITELKDALALPTH